MLGTDYILDALAAEGIDHLFMVPGGLIDPFLTALGRQTAIRPIVAAQEGGAAYMADGYARASRKFGTTLCIGGPGLGNTVTPIAAAATDASPLLLLSGEVATYAEGMGFFQDASSQTLDDVEVMKPLTAYSSSVDHPRNLGHLLRRALLEMWKNSRPVHLSLPTDIQIAPIDAKHTRIDLSILHSSYLSMAAAASSLQYFTGAAAGTPPVRIVILAGAGVEHGNGPELLRTFAEKWHIPVATTLRAKGVLPEDHPLSLGVFGYAGTHHSRMALTDAPPDLLLILGSGLNERDTMHWSLKLDPRNTLLVNLSPSSPNSARPSPATAFCSSIPARTGHSQATTGPATNRAAIFPQQISARWDGRFPPPSECNSPDPTEKSPSSPATVACICTAPKWRLPRGIGCRSSSSSSIIPRSATCGCARTPKGPCPTN